MVKTNANYHPQVLLLGNGLIQAYGGTTWKKLLSDISKPHVDEDYVENLKCPMPLRAILVTHDRVDKAIKDKQKDFFGTVKDGLRQPLEQLLSLGFDDILTTNYSYELEAASVGKDTVSASFVSKNCHNILDGENVEQKYLIHSYQDVPFEGVDNRVWHIHGESRKPNSMILGHYYYASLINKIGKYLDSTGDAYRYRQKNNIQQKIKSWVDSFVLGDIYIMGFGMGFSEIDLWWLLNRKKRENAHHGKVYFYEPISEGDTEKRELLKLLDVEIINFGMEKPNGTAEELNQFFREFYHCTIDDITGKIQSVKKLELR